MNKYNVVKLDQLAKLKRCNSSLKKNSCYILVLWVGPLVLSSVINTIIQWISLHHDGIHVFITGVGRIIHNQLLVIPATKMVLEISNELLISFMILPSIIFQWIYYIDIVPYHRDFLIAFTVLKLYKQCITTNTQVYKKVKSLTSNNQIVKYLEISLFTKKKKFRVQFSHSKRWKSSYLGIHVTYMHLVLCLIQQKST